MRDGWWVEKGSPGQGTAKAKAQGTLGKVLHPPDFIVKGWKWRVCEKEVKAYKEALNTQNIRLGSWTFIL